MTVSHCLEIPVSGRAQCASTPKVTVAAGPAGVTGVRAHKLWMPFQHVPDSCENNCLHQMCYISFLGKQEGETNHHQIHLCHCTNPWCTLILNNNLVCLKCKNYGISLKWTQSKLWMIEDLSIQHIVELVRCGESQNECDLQQSYACS